MDILLNCLAMYLLILFLAICFFLKIGLNKDLQEKRKRKDDEAFATSVLETIEKLPLS